MPYAKADRTGRERLTMNVLASWLGYLVQVVAGFALPRLIDHNLGQTVLGIWDFSWSLVMYFNNAQLGVGSSIHRYVSRYRAVDDSISLNRAVSSVTAFQVTAATIALAGVWTLAWWIPSLFGARLGEHADETRWVVAFLGSAVAIDMAFDAYRGVITGCHRWDVFNLVDATSYLLTFLGLISVLLLGGGVAHLAFAYLCGGLVMQVLRAFAAYRVCPELRIRREYASWPIAKEMVAFGLKGLMFVGSKMLLFQGNALIIGWVHGPALLAVYSRPNALIRHVESFVNKLSFVLTPTASSMQGLGQEGKLRGLLTTSTRYSVALALPALLFLGILGGPILELWMGERYARGDLMGILCVGFFFTLSQSPAASILAGLNKHGLVAAVSLGASIVGLILGVLLVGVFDFGLTGSAIAIATALTFGTGVFTATRAAHTIGMSFPRYVLSSFWQPVLSCLPFAIALILVRAFVVDNVVRTLAFGCAACVLLIPPYWQFFLPPQIKAALVRRIPSQLRGRSPARQTPGLPLASGDAPDE
jgi:O-antigen/teichoic acid export membrane protein